MGEDEGEDEGEGVGAGRGGAGQGYRDGGMGVAACRSNISRSNPVRSCARSSPIVNGE